MKSRLGIVPLTLIALLLCVPFVAGTAVAALKGWEPASAWSADDQASAQAGSVDLADLTAARKAAGQAQAQASLLASGAGQLADGTTKLKEGAQPLAEGTDKAAQGAQQLSDGLVQLQAGTGQLGDGATKIADGVGQAVDSIVGINAVRGQIITAIDGTLKDLEGNNTAEAQRLRQQLESLRERANSFQLDPALAGQLTELKNGSRDLANQLDVSGYAFHDGIYSAAKGAKDLAAGLAELNKGVDQAVDGVNQLNTGAGKVRDMAKTNETRIGDVQRALPAAPLSADAPLKALSPIVALLLAALVGLGGMGLGRAWALRAARGLRSWLTVSAGVVGLVLAGLVGVVVLSTGVDAQSVGYAAGVLALTVLSSVLAMRVMAGVMGDAWSAVLAGVAGIAQLALGGWMWKAATAGQGVGALKAVVDLTPLNWSTSALTVIGNGGNSQILWAALGVTGGSVLLGLLGLVILTWRYRAAETA